MALLVSGGYLASGYHPTSGSDASDVLWSKQVRRRLRDHDRPTTFGTLDCHLGYAVSQFDLVNARDLGKSRRFCRWSLCKPCCYFWFVKECPDVLWHQSTRCVSEASAGYPMTVNLPENLPESEADGRRGDTPRIPL